MIASRFVCSAPICARTASRCAARSARRSPNVASPCARSSANACIPAIGIPVAFSRITKRSQSRSAGAYSRCPDGVREIDRNRPACS
ncbi:hypothetical protein DP42_4770 [Burkholderia pseudomallei]|nr:hypothetical protein DO73_4241 [Burkholderia pseudomallei]KGD23963.1 hypothetical protein DP42_4770 [Burkholderia pseudomallei]